VQTRKLTPLTRPWSEWLPAFRCPDCHRIAPDGG
jgi:hypothetical protein